MMMMKCLIILSGLVAISSALLGNGGLLGKNKLTGSVTKVVKVALTSPKEQSRADSSEEDECGSPSFIRVPNLLSIQECMKSDNSELRDLIEAFLESNLYDEDAYPGGKHLLDIMPTPDPNGDVDLTGLTSCQEGYNNVRIAKVFLVLTKLVQCINPADLATAPTLMAQGFQVSTLVYYLLQNILSFGDLGILKDILPDIGKVPQLLGSLLK